MRSFSTRQRANTTSDTVPRPRFNSPDAFPHSGVQDAGQISTSDTVRKRNNTVTTNVGPQRGVWKDPPAPAFDFQLSTAPEQTTSSRSQENTASDDRTTMIGVAVGSPTMYRTMQHAPSHAVSPPAIDFDSMQAVGSTEVDSSKPKPSKWKKISDFFKAKNSLQQQPDHPFDQLQLHDRPATSHECRASPADSHLRPNHEAASEPHAPWDDLEFEHRMCKPARKTGKDVSKPPKGKEPRKLVKYVEPSKPNKKARHQDKALTRPSKPEEIFPSASSEQPNVSGSLLNIEIPEVRLERYSVMFGSVLDKPPSSTLLARRSRTLDMLKTHIEEEELEHTRMPLPRRATSPALTKSPTFTLFPTTPTSKPSKALHNANFPRPNMPLQRPNTAPLSPGRELNEKVMPAKDIAPPQTGTSSMATSSSSRSQWVSEGSSYLSMASTSSSSSDISSLSDEDEAAQFSYNKALPISPDQPIWEILNRGAKAEPPSTKSKTPPQPQRLRTIRSEESFAAITEQSYSPSHKRMAREDAPVYPKKSQPKPEAKAEQPATSTESKTPPQPQRLHKIRSEESVAAATEGPRNDSHKRMAVEEPRALPTKPQPKSETISEPKSTKPAPVHPIIDIEQWLPKPPPPPQRKPPPTPPAPSPTIALPPVPFAPPLAHPQHRTKPKLKSRPPPSTTNNNPNRQAMKAVEISIARSIAVANRPKQVIVPMSAMRSDSLHPSDERFGDKRIVTPTLIAVPRGHGREKSQEVPVEVVEPGFI
ncbi:hypothetical protein GX50_05337 [[Emmonsia] crescens]|uniref:Uncharacterized protein n=1 Tax=[Emmonsia] crescens TaxID=73230 RepID=A0A2B7ZFV8_9EURO|nr:hypothetical protein GX50_05337 [Emmonsia crescens]